MKDKDIFKALEGFEKLVSDILLWIVFVPKTLFTIVAYPIWISDHVKAEVDGDGKFKDYVSPLLLFLVTSLVLFVIANTLESDTQKVASAERIVTDLQGSQGIFAGLGFLSLPLIFALVIELFRWTAPTQQGIKRLFYIQCYYFSPLTLSLFAYILLTDLLPEGDASLISNLSLLLLVPIFIWFLIVEIKVITRELESNILKAIGVFILPIVLTLGGIFLLVLMVDSETDAFFAGAPEKITETLPTDNPYSISIKGFENSVGDYQLVLIEQPSCLEDASPDDELTYGNCVVGSIDGDSAPEWFFEGSEGDNIAILVEPDAGLDVEVGVYDEADQFIQGADDSFEEGPEAIIQTLPSDGEFYIAVEGFDNSAGDYQLTLVELSPCAEGSSVKGRVLKYGNCVTGQVTAEATSSNWTFEGSAEDNITVLVDPASEFDAKIDVLDKSERSIQGEAQAFNFIINFIGYFYVLGIGVAVILGFRSMFRTPKEAPAQKEEAAE